MKHKVFVNRKAELDFLRKSFAEKRAHLVILYGRRRIGKTFLIEHFLSGKKGVYFLCTKGNETEQIALLSSSLAEHFNEPALKLNPFRDWRSLFIYLYEKAKKQKFVLAIDEFPFLMQANPAITSILQKYWDEYLSKTSIMLVLCGSSIGMMESAGIAYNAPLYGRRTGQWKVMPLKFHDYSMLFECKKIEKIIEFYAITGGIAFYANEFQEEKTVYENIKQNIAQKGKLLYEEGDILVKEELCDATTYFSILYAIATGKTRQTEIAQAINVPVTSLSRYLITLARLNFIKKIKAVTEPPNSKKALYKISDNFLNFWFKFIYPNKVYVEENDAARLESALKGFNAYVGSVFESVCMEAIAKIAPFEIEKMGGWWGNYCNELGEKMVAEIDIVALNSKSNEIMFAECKWQDDVNAEDIVKKLFEKESHVNWNLKKRRAYYAIFAKSFRNRAKGKNIFCFDLKEIGFLITQKHCGQT